MSTVNKEHELLRELVASRKYLFTMLADEAKERGEEYKGKAWEWLRDHNKWPTKSRRRKKDRRYGTRMVEGYTWCITTKAYGLADAESKGPSVLPYDCASTYGCRLDSNEVHETEEQAFRYAARSISILIRWKEEAEQRRKKAEEEAKNNSEST